MNTMLLPSHTIDALALDAFLASRSHRTARDTRGNMAAVAAKQTPVSPGTAPHRHGDLVPDTGDDLLSQFVRPDFDSKVFVQKCIQQNTVADDHANLKQGIAVLESQLREQVVSHHGRLIEQVSHAKDLEELVNTVSAGVARLQSSLGSVKASIREPFEVVKDKSRQLDRLQVAGEMLRYVVRVREVSTKLQPLTAPGAMKGDAKGVKDLAQAATYVSELRNCMNRPDLHGVEEVDKRRKWLEDSELQVRGKATKLLLEALMMQNQQELGNALQVMQNLDGLKGAVMKAEAELVKGAREAVASALDTSTLSVESDEQASKARGVKPKGPTNAAAAAAWKTALWQRIEAVMETITAKINQGWALHKVLSRKRDPACHLLFLQIVAPNYQGEGDWSLFGAFWVKLFAAIAAEVQVCGERSSFVKQMVTADFPRLRSLLFDVWTTARRESDAGASGAVGVEQKDGVVKAMEQLEQQHILRATSRVTECINTLFASKPAVGSDVSGLLKAINHTTQGACNDAELSLAVANATASALELFVSKCKDVTSRDGDVKAVSGLVNMSQTKNISVYAAASQLHAALERAEDILLKSSATAAAKVYVAVRADVARCCRDAVEPMFAALQASMAESFADMHAETLHQPRPPPDDDGDMEQCSRYMRAADGILNNFVSRHMSKLPASSILKQLQDETARRCLMAFVTNATLMSPLNEVSKMYLVQDMTTLEGLLGRLSNLKDLGEAFGALRALRPLLFVDDEPFDTLASRLAQVQGAGLVPHQDVVHHLMQRAPASVPPFFAAPASPQRRREITDYLSACSSQGFTACASRVQGVLDGADAGDPKAAAFGAAVREMLAKHAQDPEASDGAE